MRYLWVKKVLHKKRCYMLVQDDGHVTESAGVVYVDGYQSFRVVRDGCNDISFTTRADAQAYLLGVVRFT